MKKNIFLIGLALIVFSCGGKKKDGATLATEVCDCRKKAKGLERKDPQSEKIMLECSKLQGENWVKVSKNKTEEEAFNKVLNECWAEILGQ